MQNPMIKNMKNVKIIGNIVQKISLILLGCFVLLMADVINCSSVNYSLNEHLTRTKVSLGLFFKFFSLFNLSPLKFLAKNEKIIKLCCLV